MSLCTDQQSITDLRPLTLNVVGIALASGLMVALYKCQRRCPTPDQDDCGSASGFGKAMTERPLSGLRDSQRHMPSLARRRNGTVLGHTGVLKFFL